MINNVATQINNPSDKALPIDVVGKFKDNFLVTLSIEYKNVEFTTPSGQKVSLPSEEYTCAFISVENYIKNKAFDYFSKK